MSVISYEFAAFLFICVVLYYILPGRAQWLVLLAASMYFYAASGAGYLFFILTATVTVYAAALLLEKKQSTKVLWVAAAVNLAILLVMKYTNFVLANCNWLLLVSGREKRLEPVSWLMPLGISYYTLQSMGYVIDIYHRKYMPEKNPLRLLLFLSFFPQLVQGPIGRYDQLRKTLFRKHRWDWDGICLGMQRILWGLFKKLVAADRVAPVVLAVANNIEQMDGIYVLIGMLAYTMQLYGDFTGGIDIALGCAQLFGVELAENFDRPFASESLAEYWRRWHMSLMQWFREYVFYPLSGSGFAVNLMKCGEAALGRKRASKLPVWFASLLTWFLTGIWHGASWNFVAWGMTNCIILLVSQELNLHYRGFRKKHPFTRTTVYHFFMRLRTLLLVSTVQMFEYYGSPWEALRMFGTIFTSFRPGALFDGRMELLGLSGADIVILLLCVLLFVLVGRRQKNGSVREWLMGKNGYMQFAVWFGMFLSVLIFGVYGFGYDAGQFIYNQF